MGIVTGRKYRILTNEEQDTWDTISFWTMAEDVHYQDGSTAEDNRPINMLKRNTDYAVGAIAYAATAPSWVMLVCITAGKTSVSLPEPDPYQSISQVGQAITDGTVVFRVYDVVPKSELNDNDCTIPSMSVANSFVSQLTANGTQFYFDYQNGQYGFNTDPNRGASTFVPFKKTSENGLPTKLSCYGYTNSSDSSGDSHKAIMQLTAIADGTITLTSSPASGVTQRIHNSTKGPSITQKNETITFTEGDILEFSVAFDTVSWEKYTRVMTWSWNFD